ncbi:unnamed protein product [marine sediment metagenome]|uniref:Uncharacterized protein n=1 Tax=marine sediment metagenome TaxID=412755 RepID=X1QSY5_9ZZZZ
MNRHYGVKRLTLNDLEETRSFYKAELIKENLTGGERNSYLKALEIIEKCIKKEKEYQALRL